MTIHTISPKENERSNEIDVSLNPFAISFPLASIDPTNLKEILDNMDNVLPTDILIQTLLQTTNISPESIINATEEAFRKYIFAIEEAYLDDERKSNFKKTLSDKVEAVEDVTIIRLFFILGLAIKEGILKKYESQIQEAWQISMHSVVTENNL